MMALDFPRVTVAAIIERKDEFLLVEEEAETGLVLNQPAGHLETHESVVEGVIRETFEETAYYFAPSHLIGIYRWYCALKGVTYLRFAFCGQIEGFEKQKKLDTGIVRSLWMSSEEIINNRARHRSPLVLTCIQDYLAGKRYSLDLITNYIDK